MNSLIIVRALFNHLSMYILNRCFMCVITSSHNSVESSWNSLEIVFCSENRQFWPNLAKISSFLQKWTFSGQNQTKSTWWLFFVRHFYTYKQPWFFCRKNVKWNALKNALCPSFSAVYMAENMSWNKDIQLARQWQVNKERDGNSGLSQSKHCNDYSFAGGSCVWFVEPLGPFRRRCWFPS